MAGDAELERFLNDLIFRAQKDAAMLEEEVRYLAKAERVAEMLRTNREQTLARVAQLLGYQRAAVPAPGRRADEQPAVRMAG